MGKCGKEACITRILVGLLFLCILPSVASAQRFPSPWALRGGEIRPALDVPVRVGGGAASQEGFRLYEPNASGSNYTEFVAGIQAANLSYTLPTAYPTVSGQVLSSTDAGVMSWTTVSSGVTIGDAIAGSTANRVLYVDGSELLANSANLTFDGSTLTAPVGISTPSITDTIDVTIFAAGTSRDVILKASGEPWIAKTDADVVLGRLSSTGSLFLAEKAAADADVAGFGQLIVKNTVPNELWYVDDAGTEFQLGVSSGGPSGNNNEILTDDGAGGFVSESNLTFDGTNAQITGNLGVNAAPTASLHVADGTSTQRFFTESATVAVSELSGSAYAEYRELVGTVDFRMGASATNGYIWAQSNHYIAFGTNGNEKARLAANGNLGIGQTTPAARLDITAPASTTGLLITGDAVPGDYLDLQNSGGTSLFLVDSSGYTLVGGNSTATEAYTNNLSSQTPAVFQLSKGVASAGNTDFPQFNFEHNLTGTNHLAGTFSFLNSAIGGTDKRLAQVFCYTSAATNSGELRFGTSNAGAFGTHLYLTRQGNFGIGQAVPAGRAHVTAIASQTALVLTLNATPGDGLIVEDSANVDQLRVSATGSIFVEEKAAADADVINYGQLWVRDDQQLVFTDEGGTDNVITTTATTTDKSWTFLSPSGGSGTFYAGGFYTYGATDNDFNPSITFGTSNGSYAAHFFVVAAAGGAGGTDTVVRVTGTSITDAGVRTAADTQDLTLDDAGAAGAYYETSKKWLGQVTVEKISGPDLLANYGWCKYWDNRNTDFTIKAIEATWRGGANDAGADILLRHHKTTDWTYNAGSEPTPPAAIVSLQGVHGTEADVKNNEEGAFKRTGLSNAIDGNGSEGILFEFVTTSNGTFETCNLMLSITN